VKLPPFQTLLDAHRDDIYRFLVASVGVEDADDCFQESFLAAFRAYPGLRDATNLKGWLFTIAHRKAIDCHRSRRRAVPTVTVPDRGEAPAAPTDEALWSRVRTLPPKQRSAVALRYVEDMTYRRIGEVIGCSEAAARQNVRAGLEALRKDMDHD
jgi:RNA polymerase sigma factor (sigma-70 family)